MGRAEDAGDWLEYFHANTQAWLDDQVTRGLLPASVKNHGWKAALSRALQVYDVQVSRWASGDRTPDVESCKALARLWKVPVVDVLVAAGHLDPEEVGMAERPKPATVRESPTLARLAEILKNKDTPPDVRARVEQILAAAADLAEVSNPPERSIG